MLKSYKRIVSVLLTITIILSVIVVAPVSVSAVSKTRDEAVNWANSQIGNYIDVDGAYGNQCVDLIMAYYQYLGVSRVSGNGCDYAYNSLPDGWTRIQNTPEFVPEPGDIVVWTDAGWKNGHVAIFLSGDTSSFVSIDQNWPQGSVCKKVTHNYNYVWGVIRPNFSSSVPPSNPTISKNQYWYDIKDTIKLTGYADNATKYIAVIDDSRGNRLVDEVSSSNEFIISAESLYNRSGYGDYWACMIMENSAGGVQTEWIQIPIVDSAGYNNVYCSKPVYDIDEVVSISVETVCADGQVIGIDKDGTGRVVTQACDSTFTIPAYDLGIGTYSAYFSVYNGSGGIDTRRVNFTIAERKNLGDEFCAKIKNLSTDKFLTAVGNNVEGTAENCDKQQVWYFYRLSDNSYKIKNYYDWRAMDVDNYAASGAGTNVQVYNDWDTTAQRFYIYEAYGAYYIKPVCTDMVLDLSQTTYNLEVWGMGVDWPAQKFEIEKIDKEKIGVHSYTSKITENPTCSKTGTKTFTCTVCGDTYTETISATGHKEVIDNAVPPTYTESGLTQGVHCEICGEVLVPQEKVEPLVLFGDANCDDEVNIQDATLVQMYVAKYKVDNFNEKLADYDQSGAVNIQDATAIQMKVAKLA